MWLWWITKVSYSSHYPIMLHVKKKCKLDIHQSQFCVKKTLTWYEERCSRSRGLVTNIFPSTGSILNTSFGGWSAPTPVMLYRIEMSWSWSERICIPTKKKECSVNPSYTLHFINPCSFFNLIDFMALFLSCIQEATLKKHSFHWQPTSIWTVLSVRCLLFKDLWYTVL